MKKRSVIIFFLLSALCIGLSGCAGGNKNVLVKDPPFNSVLMVSADGKSAVGVLLRLYSNEVTDADMQQLRDEVTGRLLVPPPPPQAQVVNIPDTSDKIRVIAYGYSINSEGKPDSLTFSAGNDTGGYYVYSGVWDWITVKMKGTEYRVVMQ